MGELLGRSEREGVEEVIFLGDVFQYLIGMDKFWTQAHRKIMAIWEELRIAGRRIILIEGNRDFFLDSRPMRERCDSALSHLEFHAGDHRFFLTHGDKVNSRDFQYLFWSRVSKSRLARFSAFVLPGVLANFIVRNMEARLARTNRRFKYRRPEKELRESSNELFGRGFDRVFFGHFHSAWRYEVRDSCACVIPAWLESRCAVLVEGDGSWSLIDEEFHQVPWPEKDE